MKGNEHTLFLKKSRRKNESRQRNPAKQKLNFPFLENKVILQLTEFNERSSFKINTPETKTVHAMYEGNNIRALSYLNQTLQNRISLIYIDPPYNTGQKDFMYDDRFIDKENGPPHSNWLGFIKPRLLLAKNLLKNGGTIAISIGPEELAHLKLLCDDVFGESGFLGFISRITTKRVKGDSKFINRMNDFLVVYSKGKSNPFQYNQPGKPEIYLLEDKYVKDRGKYLLRPLDNGTINYSMKLDYEIEAPDGSLIVAGSDIQKRNKRLAGEAGKKDWCFRWSRDKFNWGLENDFIEFRKRNGRWRAYFKIYEKTDNKLNTRTGNAAIPGILEHHYNHTGTKNLEKVLGRKCNFPYPKPVSLIRTLIDSICTNGDELILDFFAGTGTTLQAVFESNRNDGGHRKGILITNNENQIAEEICYQRIKNLITGNQSLKGYPENGLIYYCEKPL